MNDSQQEGGCSEKQCGGCYMKVRPPLHLLTQSPWQPVGTLGRKMLLSGSVVTPRGPSSPAMEPIWVYDGQWRESVS